MSYSFEYETLPLHWLSFVSVFDMRSSLNGLPADLSGGRFLFALRARLFSRCAEGSSLYLARLDREESSERERPTTSPAGGAFLRLPFMVK